MNSLRFSFYANDANFRDDDLKEHDTFCEVLTRKLASNPILVTRSNQADYVKQNADNQLLNTQYFKVLKNVSKSVNNSMKSSNALKRRQDAAENMRLEVLSKLDANNIHKRRREREEQ